MRPRTKKATRYALVIVGLLSVVGVLAFVKFSQISLLIGMGKEAEKAGPPPEAVGSAVARAEAWEQTLSAVGTVAGVRSVEISNDAPGRVTRIFFESGSVVKKGQLLIELDTSVERAQLASAKSRRNLAQVNATAPPHGPPSSSHPIRCPASTAPPSPPSKTRGRTASRLRALLRSHCRCSVMVASSQPRSRPRRFAQARNWRGSGAAAFPMPFTVHSAKS